MADLRHRRRSIRSADRHAEPCSPLGHLCRTDGESIRILGVSVLRGKHWQKLRIFPNLYPQMHFVRFCRLVMWVNKKCGTLTYSKSEFCPPSIPTLKLFLDACAECLDLNKTQHLEPENRWGLFELVSSVRRKISRIIGASVLCGKHWQKLRISPNLHPQVHFVRFCLVVMRVNKKCSKRMIMGFAKYGSAKKFLGPERPSV